MNNYCIRFRIAEESAADILMAQLADFPFYSFVESENELEAYISADDWSEELEISIHQLEIPFPLDYEVNFLPYKNWNEVWESNFKPIQINDFCGVRAGFHPKFEGVAYEILIDPKMAFGTGHHATTYMVIELMQSIDFDDKVIFDFGCGTGILGILASQMGARLIDAIDYALPAFENTIRNAKVNGVNNIHVVHGTIEKIIREDYDIILANINRKVILETMDALFKKVKQQGIVILSGILQEDREVVKQAAERSGFQLEKELQKDDWIALKLKKP